MTYVILLVLWDSARLVAWKLIHKVVVKAHRTGAIHNAKQYETFPQSCCVDEANDRNIKETLKIVMIVEHRRMYEWERSEPARSRSVMWGLS
jgi:hypothetical protein